MIMDGLVDSARNVFIENKGLNSSSLFVDPDRSGPVKQIKKFHGVLK